MMQVAVPVIPQSRYNGSTKLIALTGHMTEINWGCEGATDSLDGKLDRSDVGGGCFLEAP